MEGFINMNHEEEKAVKELKMRVKDDLTPRMKEDPTIYYRFLKARDFDMDKAEKMLRKNITWRKINQMDTILQNFKPEEVFVKMLAPSFIGFDKDEDIVLYSPAGTFSIFEIIKSMTMNNITKHFMWFIEKYATLLEEHNRKTGNCQYQATLIFDADKLTFRSATSKLTLNVLLRLVQMYQDNYPEKTKFGYIINVPSYFIYVFSVLKTAIASNTLKKIYVFDNDSYKDRLLESIDADVLPAFLGGNRTDPDGNPRCRTFISLGGKFPEKYFLSNKDRYFQDNTHVTKLTLSNREKKEIRVNIKETGLLLEWEFLSRNKDIGFGVFFQDSKGKIQEMIPVERYDTPDGTLKDSYKCHSVGTYIIIFDNTYSWLSSKTVEYCINVKKPTA